MTRKTRWLTVVVVLAGLGGAAMGGCAPNTIIRRTALINAPQAPTREGQPLERGDVRLTAHVSGVNTADEGAFFVFQPGIAEVGDPAHPVGAHEQGGRRDIAVHEVAGRVQGMQPVQRIDRERERDPRRHRGRAPLELGER